MFLEVNVTFDPREARRSFRRSPHVLRALPAVTAARCARRHDMNTGPAYGSRSPRWPGRTDHPLLRLGFDVSGTRLFKETCRGLRSYDA